MAPGQSETAPLLSGGEGSYYFLKAENHQGGTTGSVRDADGGQVVEEIPHGAKADEFAPRVIGAKVNYEPCRFLSTFSRRQDSQFFHRPRIFRESTLFAPLTSLSRFLLLP